MWVVQGLEVTWAPGTLLPESVFCGVLDSMLIVVDLLLSLSPLRYTWEEGPQSPPV